MENEKIEKRGAINATDLKFGYDDYEKLFRIRVATFSLKLRGLVQLQNEKLKKAKKQTAIVFNFQKEREGLDNFFSSLGMKKLSTEEWNVVAGVLFSDGPSLEEDSKGDAIFHLKPKDIERFHTTCKQIAPNVKEKIFLDLNADEDEDTDNFTAF